MCVVNDLYEFYGGLQCENWQPETIEQFQKATEITYLGIKQHRLVVDGGNLGPPKSVNTRPNSHVTSSCLIRFLDCYANIDLRMCFIGTFFLHRETHIPPDYKIEHSFTLIQKLSNGKIHLNCIFYYSLINLIF